MAPDDDLFQQALDHHRGGRLPEAGELYHRLLQRDPAHPEAIYLLGVVAFQSGDPAQAVEMSGRALALDPDDSRCSNLQGLALMALGKDAEAEASFERTIALNPAPESYNNLGNLLKKQGRLDEAIAAYRQALTQAPAYANAHYNLGNVYRDQQELEPAIAHFRQALDGDPEHANALAGMGQILLATARPKEAVPFLERALILLPGDAELHCDLGDALQSLRQLDAATARYRESLARNPRLLRAWYSAGCLESSRQEHSAAAFCFRKALEIDPDFHEAHHNLGQVLFKLGQVEEALHSFRRAATGGDPELPLRAIATMIPGSAGSDNQAVVEARRAWAERYLPPPRPAGRFQPVEAGRRQLRVGYVSSFFQDDNWMKPVWGLINRHDRERFEVHLFSDAPANAIRHGYRSHPQDRFHDIAGLSNHAAADRVEQSGIDLLVDLNGYSKVDRLPLFALRPAPLVVSWFSMYAPSGLSCYDYLVGDHELIPPGEEQFCSEKILRVPGSYMTFEVGYPVPDVTEPPCLANRAITFGCLAPQYKISSALIAAWSRILHQVPGSSLILKSTALGSAGVRQFVHGLFEECHIAPQRVRLEGPAAHHRFLTTYNDIDIALDTFPYNGGTTTTEAIWQGVPVVCFSGDRWASRVSASILRAGGFGEFVGQGPEDYEAMAIRLANSPDSPDYLRDLRRNMRSRLLNSPVCDTASFARNVEALYTRMIEALDSGNGPPGRL